MGNICIPNHCIIYAGSLQEGKVIQEAYNFNHPLKVVKNMRSGRCKLKNWPYLEFQVQKNCSMMCFFFFILT